MPDPTWGEVGVAICVLRPAASVSEGELSGWLEGRLARYKHPKRIFFWESLPKSAYGKITKKMIREELARRGESKPSGT
jgi:acyl-CoA synthetase (AMP-forming)/AMP-acid ligase II